jgi:PKD repeat protein
VLSAARSSDADGSIVSYAWDFGDGTTATGVSPRKRWTRVGTYTLTLVVTDDQGATHTVTTTATIKSK